MKLFNKTVILVVIATSIFACGENENSNKETADTTAIISSGEVQIVEYAVEGMVCAMGCAATIKEEVAEMDGVISSEVSYENEKAHFEFDPAITSEKEIKAKIATIADGQYILSEWKEKEDVKEAETTEEEIDVEG